MFPHLFVFGRLLDLLDILQATDALADRRQIGECAAQPALVYIKLAAGDRGFLDCFLRLLLASDEQNPAAASRHILEKLSRTLQLLHGLIQVDDVNLVPLLEDVWLHLRIPPLGLVTEMHARFQKFRH